MIGCDFTEAFLFTLLATNEMGNAAFTGYSQSLEKIRYTTRLI